MSSRFLRPPPSRIFSSVSVARVRRAKLLTAAVRYPAGSGPPDAGDGPQVGGELRAGPRKQRTSGGQTPSSRPLKDPSILEFLGLKDEYSESELEEALIRHLEHFLLELGNDFAFIGRQKRLRVDDEWYRVDLVLFHRGLKCLVLVDLKLHKLTPDVGKDSGKKHTQG